MNRKPYNPTSFRSSKSILVDSVEQVGDDDGLGATSSQHTSNIIDAKDLGTSRIRVVLRIRPLSSREKKDGDRNILQPHGDETIQVWDPVYFEAMNSSYYRSGSSAANKVTTDSSAWARRFTFDKCLWSQQEDDFRDFANPITELGDQDKVFTEIGQPVLDWILGGFNCCVLAYGQTGAGKSFTMMGDTSERGDPADFGLIPRICFSLFENLESKELYSSEVLFSHMEIYNENVRDLLVSYSSVTASSRQLPENLRVREHPIHGVFVSNLTTLRVGNFEELLSSLGEKNRTIAATNSNANSSRSHAIVTITVVQKYRQMATNGLPTSGIQQKVSHLHLVDLAGSERATYAGSKGARLKEANHINQSLSVLGDVIKCLGDLKGRKGHIPFRNSTLTTVLKDSLGGNSHVVLLTAISPSSGDYEETLSTLKFADRAKRVRLRVEANISSGLNVADKNAISLVPVLQAEVQKLRELLRLQQLENEKMNRITVNPSFQDESNLNTSRDPTESHAVQEMKERVEELEHQLVDREKLIASLKSAAAREQFDLDSNKDTYDDQMCHSIITDDVPGHSGSVGKTSLPPRMLVQGHLQHYIQVAPQSGTEVPSKQSLNSSKILIDQEDNNPNNRSINVPSRIASLVALADGSIDVSVPRLVNLNQDPLFSECLVYYLLADFVVVVGAKEKEVDIMLTGPDINASHCSLYHNKESQEVTLQIREKSLVFRNGEIVPFGAKQCLYNNDCIAIGRFHLFRFESAASSQSSLTERTPPSWEIAQQELLNKNHNVMSLRGSVTDYNQVATSGMKGTDTDKELAYNRYVIDPQATIISGSAAKKHGHSSQSKAAQSGNALPNMSNSPPRRLRTEYGSEKGLRDRYTNNGGIGIGIGSNSELEKFDSVNISSIDSDLNSSISSANISMADMLMQRTMASRERRVKFQLDPTSQPKINSHHDGHDTMTDNTTSNSTGIGFRNAASSSQSLSQKPHQSSSLKYPTKSMFAPETQFQRLGRRNDKSTRGDEDFVWEKMNRVSEGRNISTTTTAAAAAGKATNPSDTSKIDDKVMPLMNGGLNILTMATPDNLPAEGEKSRSNLSVFEVEALALQKELSDMQVALQDRMRRFQLLTSTPSTTSNS